MPRMVLIWVIYIYSTGIFIPLDLSYKRNSKVQHHQYSKQYQYHQGGGSFEKSKRVAMATVIKCCQNPKQLQFSLSCINCKFDETYAKILYSNHNFIYCCDPVIAVTPALVLKRHDKGAVVKKVRKNYYLSFSLKH